jgi:hypothetical protein
MDIRYFRTNTFMGGVCALLAIMACNSNSGLEQIFQSQQNAQQQPTPSNPTAHFVIYQTNLDTRTAFELATLHIKYANGQDLPNTPIPNVIANQFAASDHFIAYLTHDRGSNGTLHVINRNGQQLLESGVNGVPILPLGKAFQVKNELIAFQSWDERTGHFCFHLLNQEGHTLLQAPVTNIFSMFALSNTMAVYEQHTNPSLHLGYHLIAVDSTGHELWRSPPYTAAQHVQQLNISDHLIAYLTDPIALGMFSRPTHTLHIKNTQGEDIFHQPLTGVDSFLLSNGMLAYLSNYSFRSATHRLTLLDPTNGSEMPSFDHVHDAHIADTRLSFTRYEFNHTSSEHDNIYSFHTIDQTGREIVSTHPDAEHPWTASWQTSISNRVIAYPLQNRADRSQTFHLHDSSGQPILTSLLHQHVQNTQVSDYFVAYTSIDPPSFHVLTVDSGVELPGFPVTGVVGNYFLSN